MSSLRLPYALSMLSRKKMMLCPICKQEHKPLFYRGKKALICMKDSKVFHVILIVPADDHDLHCAVYDAMLKGD